MSLDQLPSRLLALTLNVDCGHNTMRVLRLLQDLRPDVICLQEILQKDFRMLRKALQLKGFFVPMTRVRNKGRWCNVGICILSRYRIFRTVVFSYVGGQGTLQNLTLHTTTARRAVERRVICVCSISSSGFREDAITVANTHFTWVPDGKPDDFQRCDARVLIDYIHRLGECVLFGDFNAARGTEIFGMFASAFTDNIPLGFDTSIDPQRHKVSGLRAMVDGIFSTPAYDVSQVGMIFGASDHAAIIANISRK